MRTISKAVIAATACMLTTGIFAGGAQAHEHPKAGTACQMSGMTTTVNKKTFICQTSGGKLLWGKGLPISASPLKVIDAWTKVASTGMSATFGVITNPTNAAIKVIGATSPYSPIGQLHEVVTVNGSSVMQQRKGGFTIPAGGSLTLQPGGNHIMLVNLVKPVAAGALVPVTLTTSTGAQVTFKAVGKVFAGGNETYNGSTPAPSGMSDMKM